MNSKGTILAGLVLVLLLVTFPIWYMLVAGGGARPEPVMPQDVSRCVEERAWMAANHMDLLNRWRDAVVRDGEKFYTSASGEKYEMSLTRTCLECHVTADTRSRAKAAGLEETNFCYQCHQYADVHLSCWQCHLDDPGGDN